MFRKVAFLMCFVGPLFAQVHEELKVVLRDTRFHVTDKDGFPVKGLTQDDFSFSIGREPLSLTTFEEVDLLDARAKSETSGVDEMLPKRNIIILVDTSNMDRRTFDQLIPSIDDLLEREAGPGTLIKLVQLEQYLTHLTPFSNQRESLDRGLEKLEYQGWFRQQLMLLENQVISDYEEFRHSVDSGMPGSVREANALNTLSSIDDKERAKLSHFNTFYANVLALARILAPMPGDRSLLYFTGGLYLENRGKRQNTHKQLADLAKMLNHQGVTIFSFLHNSPVAIGAGDWQASFIGHVEPFSAMRELVSYSPFRNELDVVGLGSNNSLMENTGQLETGAREASALTGGFFRTSTKRESLSFDVEDFFDATQHYYRFTYTIEQEQEKKNLKIKLNNPKLDYVLRYGKRFKSPESVEKWTHEEVLLNFEQTILYGDVFRNDLDCAYGFRTFTSPGGEFVIPVYMALSMDRPSEKGLATGFALFDRDRSLLDVVHDTVVLGDKGKKPFLYHVLISDRVPAFVRFFLQDLDDGALSFQEFPIQISPSGDDIPEILGLTVGESTDRDLILLHRYEAVGGAEKKRTKRLSEDPFLGKELVWVPPLEPEFDRNALVPVFFQLSRAQAPLIEYVVTFSLVGRTEEIDIPGQLTGVQKLAANVFRLKGVTQLKDVPIGEYALMVTLESKNHSAVTARTSIVVR